MHVRAKAFSHRAADNMPAYGTGTHAIALLRHYHNSSVRYNQLLDSFCKIQRMDP